MTTQTFCDALCKPGDLLCNNPCRAIQNCPLTDNQIYQIAVEFYNNRNLFIDGVSTIVTQEGSTFVAELILATYGPWIIVLFITIIILAAMGYLKASTALLILIITVFVAVVMAFISAVLLDDSVVRVVTNVRNQVTDNFNKNSQSIAFKFLEGVGKAPGWVPCSAP